MLHIIKVKPLIESEPRSPLMDLDKLQELEKEAKDATQIGLLFNNYFSVDEVATMLKAVDGALIATFDKPTIEHQELWETEVSHISDFIEPANFFAIDVPPHFTEEDLLELEDDTSMRDFNDPDDEFFQILGKDLCLRLLDYWDFKLPGYTAFSDYVKENM